MPTEEQLLLGYFSELFPQCKSSKTSCEEGRGKVSVRPGEGEDVHFFNFNKENQAVECAGYIAGPHDPSDPLNTLDTTDTTDTTDTFGPLTVPYRQGTYIIPNVPCHKCPKRRADVDCRYPENSFSPDYC